jgi:phosphoadenosine phosphosulfate reductase
VPYNPLLDKGYRSIGDWHSTAVPDPTAASDAGERSGRWQGKSAKTECGLHKNYHDMKAKFEESAAAKQAAA